jgi:hypothetical protein
MSCGRCQANFKRKYKDFHDCIRHLLNQHKTMQEHIKLLKKELEVKDQACNQRIEKVESTFMAELALMKVKMQELKMGSSR